MKDTSQSALQTPELPGIPATKRRGRPKKENAATNAQRQSRYREKKRWEKIVERERASDTFAGESEEKIVEWMLQAGKNKLGKMAWMEYGRRMKWI